MKFSSHKGRKITFRDADGDRFTVRLAGPGRIYTLIRRSGGAAPLLYVVGGDPTQTILSGTVRRDRHGDGVAQVQQITGAGTVQNLLATDPAFQVAVTVP